ncbi:MAG: hypothetical protein IT486_05510 [Gammaproteobacteria bacterium]|nr:hypothetical protein [Gammaproteobacteria bacterium]
MHVEHIVYLSSAGCSLWSWHDTAFAESPVRTAVGEDPTAIVDELGHLAEGPVAVLVDMIDEEHVRDAVARLGRRDQQQLVERKLARRFPRTTLRAAQLQGRSPSSPAEDRVLLSGLTRPEPVRVVLERLAAAHLPVAGVWSPALLTARLIDPALLAAPFVMLVLRRGNGRQQHSLFVDGVLAGSRRLRGSADAALEDAGVMMRQIEESLRYFDPSFEPSAATPLDLVLADADHALLDAGGGRGEGWRLHRLDVAALARRLRLRAPLDAARTERIFIELLRAPGAAASFLPAAGRHRFDLYRLRSFGKVACVALAGAALVGTLHNALHILDARASLVDAAGAAQQLGAVLPGGDETQPAGVDPLEMQQVVAAYDALDRGHADPRTILAAIGAAVSQRPHIQLDAIEWRAGPAPTVPSATDEDAGEETGDEEAESGAGPDGRAPDDVRVTLRGRVRPFTGDYPPAFDEVEALVEALREDPEIRTVTPRELPLDVSSGATLSGEVTRGQEPAEARFTLEVVMRAGHERA